MKFISEDKIGNLPFYPNAFVGRTHHISALCGLLQQEKKRLITLLGPGGIGKTRLSVKIGELMAETFTDGVCFVPLDAVVNHEQVSLYIGHRLGLTASVGKPWIDEIIEFLADKQLLLILDNLEQILAAAHVIDQIVRSCPKIKVLVTSREILGLSHEIEYPLDGLSRPNHRLFPGPEDLLKFSAVDLFVQKAQAVKPGFQLTAADASAIVQICQELDGLPLPIELAAARIKLFSPEIILKKLSSNSNLLKTTSRDVIFRHQTIRNTVSWSYDLLDTDEQALFQQLSLFRSGFTLAALESVGSELDPMDAVESFMNKSLIVKRKELQGIPRFGMLKLIRDYGLEQLDNNPQREVYYRRFAQYFITFLQDGKSMIQRSAQSKWTTLIAAEYENLTLALEWLSLHEPEMAIEMGGNFWRFHLNRGFLKEGLEMIQSLLFLTKKEGVGKARLLEGAGVLSQNLGNYLAAKDCFKDCLDLWQGLQDRIEITKALNNLGWAEWRIGNYDHGISYSENALEIALEITDYQGEAKSLNNLAWIYMSQGRFEKAEELQRSILQLHIRNRNKRGIAFAKTNLGWVIFRTGKLIEAGQLIDESIQLFNSLEYQQLLTFSKIIKAEYLFEIGELEAARELLNNYCLPNFTTIGDVWGIAYSLSGLGRISFQEKDFSSAHDYWTSSMEIYQNSHDRLGQATTHLWLAKLHVAMGSSSLATTLLEQSLRLAANMGANQLLMEGHLERAIGAIQIEAYPQAMQNFAIADYYAEQLGSYQQQKYRSRIQSKVDLLRSYFKMKGKEVKEVISAELGQSPVSLQAKPIPNEKLLDSMRILLDADPSPIQGKSLPIDAIGEDPFIRHVRGVIEAHLDQSDFGLKEICREIGMSHSQLHRRLHTHTGQSVTKFIRAIRLDKAKELLADPQFTIAAIAADTGFKDPDYFYRVFKQTFGMTPGKFRKTLLYND